MTVTPTFISVLLYPGCVIGNTADFERVERVSLKVIPCYDGLVGAIHELPLLLRSPASAYLRVTLHATYVSPAYG